MKKLILDLVFLGLIPWSGATGQTVQNEGFARALGPGWTSMYHISPDARYNGIRFVSDGDTFKDWKKTVYIESHSESSQISPEELLNRQEEKGKAQKGCSDKRQFLVIAKDETSVLVRWHRNACGNSQEEDAVTRVIIGKHSWYALSYIEKVHEMTPDTFAQWSKTFSDATFDSVTLSFDPAWMRVDVDEVVPFAMDKVLAALKPAMESQECKVTETTAERIKCKRPKVKISWREASGDESVEAVLEAKSDHTQVRITTDMRSDGSTKKNWSTPIFEGMLKNLQNAQP
ncbi:MAG: hypothetical protein ABSD76_09925 [Terriglobales bacterium]|jgi:hypothetical protein